MFFFCIFFCIVFHVCYHFGQVSVTWWDFPLCYQNSHLVGVRQPSWSRDKTWKTESSGNSWTISLINKWVQNARDRRKVKKPTLCLATEVTHANHQTVADWKFFFWFWLSTAWPRIPEVKARLSRTKILQKFIWLLFLHVHRLDLQLQNFSQLQEDQKKTPSFN